MRLPWTRTENRAATDYTSVILTGLAALNLGTGIKTDALAVVEAYVSLIAEPLLVAEVEGVAIPKATLYTMARDALRTGNSVWAINTTSGQLRLQRAYMHEVIGDDPDPSGWDYPLEIAVPNGTIKTTLPSTSVIHLCINPPPKAPWCGLAPWQTSTFP